MRGPEIITFSKGVIEWTTDPIGCFCVIEINGEKKAEGVITKYKLTAADETIKLTAVYNGRKASTKIKHNATRGTLEFLPVDVKADGERITWDKAGGASSYRVYDTEMNAVTVTRNTYDLSDRNIALCVCPNSRAGGVVRSATPELIAPIPYLRGAGSKDNPYRIRTPFELRTIDCFEIFAACKQNAVGNYYVIENTLDYGEINALEGDSNLYRLKAPFFGTLDGNNNRLVNVRVNYHGGYWSLFDYITQRGCVKNMIFENAEITNTARDNMHPVNPSVALIAYTNYGEITGIKLDQVRLASAGGGVGGLVVHNYGRVTGCTVFGEYVQDLTSGMGNASYEMSGIALENHAGGVVGGNRISSLKIRGADNIRSAAGIVSVNRDGGTVCANEFDSIMITGAVGFSEYGGLVAYNAGTVECTPSALGTLTVNGERVEALVGVDNKGKAVGKNDGTNN